MKYWLLIIFIIMGGFVTACVSSVGNNASTSLPEAPLTPKRIFAYPVCEVESQMYQEGKSIPDDKVRVWIDIGTDIASPSTIHHTFQ